MILVILKFEVLHLLFERFNFLDDIFLNLSANSLHLTVPSTSMMRVIINAIMAQTRRGKRNS